MIQVDLAPSGRLRLHFEDGHSITLPLTRGGLSCLRRVLMAQAREAGRPHSIATPASPTQWDIDQWLRTHTAQAKANLGLNITLEL